MTTLTTITNEELMLQGEQLARQLYDNHSTPTLVYHNINHTEEVVKRVHEIAAHYDISEDEYANLVVAAWMHDVGHLFTEPAFHEEKSVEIFDEFAQQVHLPNARFEAIKKYIMATKMPTSPEEIEAMIICDADTYHFGTKDFKKVNKKVKKEWAQRMPDVDLSNWLSHTYALITGHRYYTNYCIEQLTPGKEKNMAKLKSKMSSKLSSPKSNIPAVITPNDAVAQSVEQVVDQHAPPEKLSKKKMKAAAVKMKHEQSMLNKGIQTMLRLTSENHLRLSDMADNKASILISVNAIIISVILSVLLRRLEVDTHLTIPTILFLITSLATIIISILATRPKVTSGSFSREDVLSKKANLLFFGNFFKSTLDEYQWAMKNLMNDADYLYSTVVQDIYYLAVVLGKKYKLVRIAYTIFMIGIAITVVAFVLAIMLHQPANPIIESTPASPF